MVIEVEKGKRSQFKDFFREYKWNYLAEAVLDGCMGVALVDDLEDPHIVVLHLPELELKILGGDAAQSSAREYIQGLPHATILIPSSSVWESLLKEEQAGKLIRMKRYAFSSENLREEHLRSLGSQLPEGYRLSRLNLDLAKLLAQEKSGFAEEHMQNFESPEDFIQRGFGFCVLKGGKIVSVATTFAICKRGIEIQINTRRAEQGQGLGTTVAAQLLLHSLANDLDPNWDAANRRSARLAERLGYTPQGNYYIYVVVRSKLWVVLGTALLRITGFLNR